MRMRIFSCVLCLMLCFALPLGALAEDYALRLSGQPPEGEPLVLISPEAGELPGTLPLMRTLRQGAGGVSGGVAPGVTVLWGSDVSLSEEGGSLTGELVLTGELLGGTAIEGAPSLGVVGSAVLFAPQDALPDTTGLIQSEGGYAVVTARQSQINVLTGASGTDLVLLGVPEETEVHFQMGEGSLLTTIGAVSFSTSPLSSLSMAAGTMIYVGHTPSEALPVALPMPASIRLAESTILEVEMGAPMDDTPEKAVARLYGDTEIYLAVGANLILSSGQNGRVFSFAQGGTLTLTLPALTLYYPDNTYESWSGGGSPFTVAITFDDEGNVTGVESANYAGDYPLTPEKIRLTEVVRLTSEALAMAPAETEAPAEQAQDAPEAAEVEETEAPVETEMPEEE